MGKIWKMCETWLGVQLVHKNMPKQHFLGFTLAGMDKRERCVWRMLWMIVIWYTWKHMNEIIFKNRKCDVIGVCTSIQLKT